MREESAPETRRSIYGPVKVYAGRSRPRVNEPASYEADAIAKWLYRGTCNRVPEVPQKSQSSQVNSSASGRDDIGPDLLQRYDITGLGGPDQ